MAITETLDLQASLREQLARDLSAVIVNGVLPRRFSAAELKRISPLRASSRQQRRTAGAEARLRWRAPPRGPRARCQTARDFSTISSRACGGGSFEAINVPFRFAAELDLEAIGGIAEHLRRKL